MSDTPLATPIDRKPWTTPHVIVGEARTTEKLRDLVDSAPSAPSAFGPS